ncbi:asparagine synthase (glutamine-hydrolyzing) [Pseudomonas carassii]|uniref:asparagine synthase (glutamine-hydrolyzing) n=1 Tax=Pseudomonas carassii TaxID=3115855 RepID=A0ABU7HGA6_9PSED|nr:asparagine synthase (glutamine-hydrolyzing) [Pseudomonas sp. 137P]MEE1890347.1 asparagine synthase (glutamine-hydrolyzing) [Pseudomonas sp. 137P]
MCAIAGEITLAPTALSAHFVRAACARMLHRGPDEAGFFNSPQASLGMRRLKVIGLNGGSQPSRSLDGDVVCVFNGEIYNHKRLRQVLAERGRVVEGSSDAHVIPALYQEFGLDFVHQLEGMFAIALYDTVNKRLHLFTDRAGKKPIFYSQVGSGLAFASELPALMAHPDIDRAIDPLAIDQYLSYRVVPAPHTIYAQARKLEPGSRLSFTPGEAPQVERYWRADFSRTDDSIGMQEAVDGVEQRLLAAVEDRLEAEVPLGAMLSGGLDSSLVVAMAKRLRPQPLHTFSVGFQQDAFDESPFARRVSRFCGTEHHEYQISADDVRVAVDAILTHMGEPFAFPSAIASYYMYRLARREVTVVLTGDGSDEIFAGYNRYKITTQLPALKLSDQKKVDLQGLAQANGSLAEQYQAVLIDGVRQGLKHSLYSQAFAQRLPEPAPFNYLSERLAASQGQPHLLNRLMQMDYGFWLPDAQLVKIDRMAMAHSVEPRSPMLDQRVVDYVTRLAPGLKLQDGNEKAVLKKVAARGYLPDDIIHRRKQELAVPLEHWLATHLREDIQATLTSERALSRGYFDADRLQAMVAAFQPDHTYALWTLYMLERWHQLAEQGFDRPVRHSEQEQLQPASSRHATESLSHSL